VARLFNDLIAARRISAVVSMACRRPQPLINIPGRQPPLFLATEQCDGRERILMLMAFNPKSSKARSHVLTEPFNQ
jgi:hypothetical protein